MQQIQIANIENLAEAAKVFVKQIGEDTIYAFEGEMGAGKTTFIKAICAELGVSDIINSPTFSIVNEYRSDTTGELIYHFDFYRINKLKEAVDMGCEDYFESGALCFIEWPERIIDLLPENHKTVKIKVLDNNERVVEIV